MLNIPDRLSDAERRFMDDFAALLAYRGMPLSSGRLYGYLLLQQTPVSLEKIGADLELSKGGAWNAAKVLERCGHVRRYGEPGSKRLLYAATENYAAPMLEQTALLGSIGGLLKDSAGSVAKAQAATRLEEMAEFYFSMKQSMEDAIRALDALRAQKRAGAA
ncbi:hypothetical protein LJR219_002960 [Phenylobacterium sp. LjRoot219]|uniref:GbsR/MarR family transcriptional regulator n=1 Tax=Phenylobacterium sp. LjRoot219 TaxID=3342283 RepID=UPI003ED11D17